MEGALLGMFMLSACLFGILLEHPQSPVREALDSAVLRRTLMGLAMGTTAILLIYSPWGKQSGAHFNPAVTLTFLRLNKISRIDALFYVVAQFVGGTAAVLILRVWLRAALSEARVAYVATVPGRDVFVAAIAEFMIAFVLMTTVLNMANHPRASKFTGIAAGALVAIYITFEAPFSGMSMNPARSFSSALPSRIWSGFWIYLFVPPIAMLSAAELFLWWNGHEHNVCAKLHHNHEHRCIHCGSHQGRQS